MIPAYVPTVDLDVATIRRRKIKRMNVGNFGAPHEQSRRVVKVDCFDLSHNPTNVFAAPIEGLFAIVDLEARDVLDVIDLGVVPLNQETYSLAVDAQRTARDVHPLDFTAPDGGNIEIDGWQVSWNHWRFHLRSRIAR